MADCRESAGQCLLGSTDDRDSLGFFGRGIYLFPNRMPVDIIHMHMCIYHTGGDRRVGQIHNLRRFRTYDARAYLLDLIVLNKNLISFFELIIQPVIQLTTNNICKSIHSLLLSYRWLLGLFLFLILAASVVHHVDYN